MQQNQIRLEFQRLIEKNGSADAKSFLLEKSKKYSELAKSETHEAFSLAYKQKSIRLAELSLKVDDIAYHEKLAANSLSKIILLDKKILESCEALSDHIGKTSITCHEFIKESTSTDGYNQLLSQYDLRTRIKTYGPRIPCPHTIFEYLHNVATDRTAIVLSQISGRPVLHPTFESVYPQLCPMHKLFFSFNEEIYFKEIWNKLRDLTNHVIRSSTTEAYRKAAFISNVKTNRLLSASYVGQLIFDIRENMTKRSSEYHKAQPQLLPSIIFHEDLKHCENSLFLSAPPAIQSSIGTDALLVGDGFEIPKASSLADLSDGCEGLY